MWIRISLIRIRILDWPCEKKTDPYPTFKLIVVCALNKGVISISAKMRYSVIFIDLNVFSMILTDFLLFGSGRPKCFGSYRIRIHMICICSPLKLTYFQDIPTLPTVPFSTARPRSCSRERPSIRTIRGRWLVSLVDLGKPQKVLF